MTLRITSPAAGELDGEEIMMMALGFIVNGGLVPPRRLRAKCCRC